MQLNPSIASILSAVFGLILFILGGCFLNSLGISVYSSNTDQIDDNEATSGSNQQFVTKEMDKHRSHLLEWGSTAAIVVAVGLFQCVFSIAYIIQLNCSRNSNNFGNGSHGWDLASFAVHFIFLICIFGSVLCSIQALLEESAPSKILEAFFMIAQSLELVLLIIILIVFETEFSYLHKVLSLFSCNEFKVKLEGARNSWINPIQSRPVQNVPMRRLVEEQASFPI